MAKLEVGGTSLAMIVVINAAVHMQAQNRPGVVPAYVLKNILPHFQRLVAAHLGSFPAQPREKVKRKRSDGEQDDVTDCIDLTEDSLPGTPPLQADDKEGPLVITHLFE